LDKIAHLVKKWQKPVFIWAMGEKEKILSFQREAWIKKIPFFHELRRAVECMSASLLYERRPSVPPHPADTSPTREISPQIIPVSTYSQRIILDEYDSKKILREAGLPAVREAKINSEEEALSFALETGYPVVLKALMANEIHKSEKGLIRLNLWTEERLRKAFHDLRGKISPDTPLLIQEQIQGIREIILGYLKDEQFGPCVMAGFGGIFAETLNDTVFSAAPIDHEQGLNMLNRLKNQKLLRNIRGLPAVSMDDIAQCLVSLGKLGTQNASLREIDVNPLILSAGGPVIADATIITDTQ
jgi:acetyltransferase